VGRYAHAEIERRFIATSAAPIADSPWQIEDRYIDGTALRLRRLTTAGEAVLKLTQKIRPDPSDPAVISITNIYLDQAAYDLLASLPAAVLRKTRSVCWIEGFRFAVDTFEGELAGLRLAEIEVQDFAAPLPHPPWLGREVTHEDGFSGGRLVRASAADLAELLDIVE
jgi:CYTH domain-containing protein